MHDCSSMIMDKVMHIEKVLFLDIDGVLNIEDGKRGSNHIDKGMVMRLNKVLSETGAKVVISSTWRCSMTKEEIDLHLRGCGFIGDIVGMTADNDKSRFAQISDWMDENWADDFVILDDIDVFSHMRNIPAFVRIADKHFFRTDKLVGLTDEIADRMIARLNATIG